MPYNGNPVSSSPPRRSHTQRNKIKMRPHFKSPPPLCRMDDDFLSVRRAQRELSRGFYPSASRLSHHVEPGRARGRGPRGTPGSPPGSPVLPTRAVRQVTASPKTNRCLSLQVKMEFPFFSPIGGVVFSRCRPRRCTGTG